MSAEKIAKDTVQDADQWQFEFDAIIPIVCSIIATSCYFCLKTFFKQLHIIIKNILIVLSIHNCIMSLIAASIFLIWNEDTSFEKCVVLSIIVKSITFLAAHNLSLISYVRYHLAIKTAKSKAINVPHIVFVTIGMYVFEYLVHIVSNIGTKTKIIETCMMNDSEQVNEYVPVFDLFKTLAILTIGLYYDGMLLLFLKNQNQVQQNNGLNQVVPWKSGSDTYDYNVPVAATTISLITTCVGSFIFVNLVANERGIQLLTTGYIFPSILLPSLLLLTIRTALEHKAIPQIPQELNFHEDQDSQSEIQDDNVQVNDGIQVGVQQSNEEAEDNGEVEDSFEDGFELQQNVVDEDAPSQMNDRIIIVQPAKPNLAGDMSINLCHD